MDNDALIVELGKAQAKHLRTIEAWAKQQPRVAGVPIVQALIYDLIQVVNHNYLNKRLAQETEAADG